MYSSVKLQKCHVTVLSNHINKYDTFHWLPERTGNSLLVTFIQAEQVNVRATFYLALIQGSSTDTARLKDRNVALNICR